MNIEKHVLVISGGSVDYTWAEEWLRTVKIDFVIAADKGLVHADQLGLKVNLLLGDYDSCDPELLEKYRKDTTVLTYPTEKDYTDTDIALQKAMELNPSQIYLLGTTGTRYDHTMTNIFMMRQALEAGIECFMLDPHNRIYLKNSTFVIEKEKQYGEYVSFLPLTQQARLTLNGMKYPLNQYLLTQGSSICQSNEIANDWAEIIIEDGILIVFETKD